MNKELPPVLETLRGLPSEIFEAAVEVVVLLPGHHAQKEAAAKLVKAMKDREKEAVLEAVLEALLELASTEADRLQGRAATLDAHQRILRDRRLANREALAGQRTSTD
jgi:hypothetical protein